MAKPDSVLPGPAGLADWLPLLGSICQVLATLGDRDESEPRNPRGVTAQPPESSQESGEERG